MNDFIYPLAKDTIDDLDVYSLCDWLRSFSRLTKDKLTVQFEHEWANYIGSKYACFVNSGSSANLLMIYAAKLMVEKKSLNSGRYCCS